jgi:hypothetical protein
MSAQHSDLEKTVEAWRKSLCPRIELGSLIARNPIAHKWKATYRSIVLRELVCWRVTDLLAQVAVLQRQGHFLGAVILTRSVMETLAILIYLNRKTDLVFGEPKFFFEFCELTLKLMLGSKNKSTALEVTNILTILDHSDRKYPGFKILYEHLSESAHPNYDGVCSGYSSIDEKSYVTEFTNRWEDKYRDELPMAIDLCVTTFEAEYNEEWTTRYGRLEKWLVENDEWLEANKAAF